MDHQIFAPHPQLSTLVECYWTLESPKEKTPAINTIVPDGSMKMIFHYGDPYKRYTEFRGGMPPAGRGAFGEKCGKAICRDVPDA